ncbi:MAG: flavodoxin-dependent (E)-4-hydroxy-3-methylbut-2-enyl-diphosphate synthase [Candidatus Margulisbacteria bacterium]|nr:flavodoxin-dependent (E)-4-hydroxy-3-methylbut-2-enyl-diphosphate synthase [Candidatus Margulisiibacteriota bacterium]
MFKRTQTIPVKVGSVVIGGSNHVVIQSMTNTCTSDKDKTLRQIKHLVQAGAEIVRLAVPDEKSLKSLPYLVKMSPVPLVADIHFDHRLALGAIDAGVAKIRINPGNIGSQDKVKEVIQTAKRFGTAIRIGANTGSIGKAADKITRSLQVLEEYIDFFKKNRFEALVISLKSSDVRGTVLMNERFARLHPYPLHIGITESGFGEEAIAKSAVGIGSLLLKGLGNTVRVSLTGDPLQEIPVAQYILRGAGLYEQGVEIISCPTCGRTEIDVEKLAREVRAKTRNIKRHLKIAVMGCIVNGPGEAQDVDLAICGGKKEGLIYRAGKIVAKVKQDKLVTELLKEIQNPNGKIQKVKSKIQKNT